MFLVACEEVIDVDLNDAEPQLAVDGKINLNEPAAVILSYTTSYFSSEEPVFEPNATMTLSSSKNETETLTYRGNGLYLGRTIIGQVGVTYQLSITIGEQTYQGSSQLLTPTEIINLNYARFDGFGSPDDEDLYNLEIVLKNNPNEENFYLVKYYLNDSEIEETFSVWSHEFFPNDETVEFNPLRFSFGKDDVVTVRAYSIDEGTYDYYSQLDEIIDQQGGGSSTPFNPASNLGKAILGYFRAWSYDEKSIKVEEEKVSIQKLVSDN
jgi:hypothetical protein